MSSADPGAGATSPPRPGVAALAGLLAFGLYLVTAAPTAFWLDSSELAAAAYELGVPHPPGHPLFVMVAKLATLLPFGGIAFRVHALCGALMGLGVALAVVLAQRLWPRAGRWPILAVAIALAVTTPFWFHGVRAEVYPLQLVIAAGIALLALRVSESGSRSDLALLGLVTGLGLANHHYLTVWMAPGVLWIVLHTRPGRSALRKTWFGAALGLGLGLLTYAAVPLRAAALTTVRWGAADTPEGFWWLLTAKAFQKTAREATQLDIGQTASDLAQLIGEQIGWILPALALVGLILLARRRPALGVGLGLLLIGNVVSQVLFGFDPTNPDVGGYFLLAVWLTGALAVGPLGAAVQAARALSVPTRRLVQASAVAVPLVAAGIAFPRGVERCDLSDLRDSDHLAGEVYEFAATDALVVTSYFETIFNLWYRDVAECRRPDVAVVHRLFRTYPGYDAWLTHRYPELVDGGMLGVEARTGQLDADWLSSESERRSVLLDADPTLPDWIRRRALPAGLLLQLAPMPLPEGPWPDAMTAADVAFWQYLYRRIDSRQRETGGNLLWVEVNQMAVFGAQGREQAARRRFERAWELAPGDPDLLRMAREVGLSPPQSW